MLLLLLLLQMSSDHQYKPLDETTAPADEAATQDDDGKKGCTRCVPVVATVTKFSHVATKVRRL